MSLALWPAPHFFDPVNQLQPGLNLAMPRSTAAVANWRLYNNDLDGLFDRQANEINGLEVVSRWKSDILRFGWFSTFTDLLVDAVLSDRPGVLGSEPTDEDWAVVEEGLRDLSVTGAGCIVVTGNEVWSEPSQQVFEWLGAGSVSHRGWVIIRQYYEGEFGESEEIIPNRAQVLVVDEVGREAWVRHYLLNQSALGNALDDAMSLAVPVVLAVYEGVSHYDAWRDVARELMVRFTLQSRILNRHSSPNMQGPQLPRGMPGLGASAETERVFGYRSGGQYLERDADDPEFSYLTWNPPGALEDAHVERLVQELHVLSRMPPAVFGLSTRSGSASQPASGVAYDRALFPLLARVRRFRRHAERFMAGIYPGAVIEWSNDPLAAWRERVDAEVQLVQSGIGSVAEARVNLGRPDGVAGGQR